MAEVKSQIRLSDYLYEEIKKISNETGDSMNGTMQHLLNMGIKVYKNIGITPAPQKEE